MFGLITCINDPDFLELYLLILHLSASPNWFLTPLFMFLLLRQFFSSKRHQIYESCQHFQLVSQSTRAPSRCESAQLLIGQSERICMQIESYWTCVCTVKLAYTLAANDGRWIFLLQILPSSGSRAVVERSCDNWPTSKYTDCIQQAASALRAFHSNSVQLHCWLTDSRSVHDQTQEAAN